MSERIECQPFDGEPYGHSNASRRTFEPSDAFGPADPVEDNRLGKCPKCGSWERLNGDGTIAKHDDELGLPCRGFRWTPKETDRA